MAGSGDAKVEKLEPDFIVNHVVVQLEVAVNIAQRVQVVEGREGIAENSGCHGVADLQGSGESQIILDLGLNLKGRTSGLEGWRRRLRRLFGE